MSIPYIVKSWRGGISDEYTRGIVGSFKFGYNLDIHKRRDSLSCNYAMQTIATVSDLLRFAVAAKDGSTYAFGAAGSVYAIAGDSADPVTTFVYNDENGAIKGGAEWQESSGANYLYWATATSVARAVLNGSPDTPWAAGVATQDYKVTLDSADWHPMKNASGSLMIGNGNYLAEIAYDGSFDPAALNIRPGNLIKCLEERDDYVIIGSERKDKSEEGHIWSWIVTEDSWLQKKKIPVRGVNALIDTELLLMQGGTFGELFYSDFANTSPLNSIADGGEANPGGATIYNDLATLGIYGTTSNQNPGIYSYGRRMRNRPFALNLEYRLAASNAGSTVTEIGAVWTAHGSLFASWKVVDGSTITYGIDMVSSTTRASARYEGLEFNGGSPQLKKTFQTVKLEMEPLPSSTSLSAIYKSNRGSWRYAALASGATTYSTAESTECEFIINDNAKVIELGVELTPSGSSTPEVTAIVANIAESSRDH